MRDMDHISGLRNIAFQFFHLSTAPVGLGLLIVEVSRSQSADTPQSAVPLGEFTACHKDLCLTTHNTHKRQTFMPQARFKTAIPASERRQTPALKRCGH
jgi:hypothetical protein